MRIGILTTGHPPENIARTEGPYDGMFRDLLDGHGFTFKTWMVLDGDFPASPDDADGWLITGSRHGVYDDLPWIPPLMDFIRSVAEAGKPMVGICFGHQAMAQALGGRVEKFDGGFAIGRRPYDWQGKLLHLNAWHQDQVITPPEGAEVVASNDFCAYAALRYSPQMFSVQPHPEFSDSVIAGLLESRRDHVPAALIAEAEAQLGQPIDQDEIAGQLAAVLKGEGIGA